MTCYCRRVRGKRAKAQKRERASGPADAAAVDLPNTSAWQPRAEASESLGVAFLNRCAAGERHLRGMLQYEKETAIDAFDSGKPFEAAVREEISRLLPDRYAVTDGVVVDRNGLSAGHADLVIFNKLWFVPVNAPISANSTRRLIPVEGAYAIGEIKQRLTKATLDDAIEKLVVLQRLERPRTFAHRVVENRESENCSHGLTNPLFTFILAAETDESEFQVLIKRFLDISRKLKRLEVVRSLCVFSAGSVGWGFKDPERREIRPALFMRDDLFKPIVPTYSAASRVPSLYALMQLLHLHLFHSVLGPEDLATAYSFKMPPNISVPTDDDLVLQPDSEWRERLTKPCRH